MITGTATSTKTDIRRVFEKFSADLSMLVRRTGTMSLEWAGDVAYDVTLMAMSECLASVHVHLLDAHGRREKVHEYKVREGEVSNDQRPGGNDWPHSPSGRMVVIVTYSDKEGAERLKRSGSLIRNWGPSVQSTDYSGMHVDGQREYSVNAYGLSRKSYTI